MLAVITRYLTVLSLAILFAWIANGIWGALAAFATGMATLSIPLLYAYFNLARLQKFILLNRVETLPAASGLWGEVFSRLERLVRNMKGQVRNIEMQHERFIQAFQASPNGIIMLDDQDQIEWCNAIAEQFFGLIYKRDALQKINYLIRRPEFIRYLNDRLFDEPLLIEQMGPSSNLSLMLQAFPFAENRRLLLIQDVTDLRKTEAMRRDFVANVSHEMRTPLTVMMGFLETVQTLKLEESQKDQYLDMMMTQAKRMKNLVEDLLTLANLEANTLPAPTQQVQMNTIFALLKNDADALSQLKHVLNFKTDTLFNILGDERELLSAFGNLVSNAVRYTPENGVINVYWVVNGSGQGVFSVQDSGPGISPEHLPRLTERFYRVDRSRSRETGGTGLGLAIVKHIANRHQAQLLIESVPGAGSTFKLIFPSDRLIAS
jgi:two-component system phosphate regulon sensor histidine kinase PhoR